MLKPLSFFAPLFLLFAAACAPAEDGSSDPSEEEPPEAQDTAEPSSDVAVLDTETGWLSVGSDGSVLTTFLDAGGRYRDFRNGAPADAGTWERRPDGAICFAPDEGLGDCWNSSTLDADGSAIVTSADGKRVEVKRITYTAPPVEDAG